LVASLLCGCGDRAAQGTWPLPNSDLEGTRSAAESSIDARSVARLGVRWRFRFTARPVYSGIFASTPVVDRDTVYVQDLRSNVFALDRSTGAVRW
jgi:glucose dehydrogenase